MNCIKRATTIIVFLLSAGITYAGDYEKAWEALHRNDKPHAYELFRKVIKSDPAHKSNAIAALMLLEVYEGNSTHFLENYPDPIDIFADVNAYSYALWFNEGVLGEYGKKKGAQLLHLNRLQTDSRYNGSMQASGNYFKGMHLLFSQQFDSADASFQKVGALDDWQFVGAFDNIKGSGFNKDYGPVKQPAKGEGFNSYNNTTIDWFTPLYTNRQSWIFVGPVFPATTAVGYAQCFVKADADQDAVLCLGGNGSLKAWVNDKLLIAADEERSTEMDQYKVRCHLKKGYNRVLLQIGYTSNNNTSSFIVRLTDDNSQVLKGLSATSVLQPYTIDKDTSSVVAIPHFAETYFKAQIAKYPQDPIFPFLLSKVYMRNQNSDKAKAAMYGLYKKYPGNPFVLYQYMECMSVNDNTTYSELAEKIKLLDPENYLVLQSNETQLEKEKKFIEALEIVQKLENRHGSNLWTISKKIYLDAYLERIDSMVTVLKDAYAKYPESVTITKVMFQYYSQMLKDPSAGVKVYEKFAADQYNYSIETELAEEYFKQNESAKGEALLKEMIALSPYTLTVYDPMINYYYAKQKYDSAIRYLEIEHKISPYSYQPLGSIASCYLQMGNKAKALDYYRQALALNTGAYSYREKIRELENKADMFSYFPQTDYYAEINKNLKNPKDTSKGYYYIFDDRRVVLYAEGANEQLTSTAVFINNKDGVEQWKESSIPYNDVYQDLTIIKAEVIKANGAKIPAERDGNQLVYTRLEPGDVVYYTYKITNAGIGRLGREYWDKFYFSASSPTLLARYSVMVADQLPLYYELTNANGLKPVESKHENYRLYTWEMKNIPAFKDENYSPDINDIGQVLHVSTVKSWDVIAEWYSDITHTQSKEDFDINSAYAEIFPDGVAGLSENDKAKRIYSYIEKYISYSSVSFRQSAYVPQRASQTLNTRLGDCKDLSTLFVSFARKAGMDANLILVSTRNNGQHSMLLPSMEFNHCVVRFKNGKDYRYLELTDNQLSFNAIPQSLLGAQILNIPYTYNSHEKVQLLEPADRFEVKKIRKAKITVDNADLHIASHSVVNGSIASATRSAYAGKAKDEQKDDLQESVAGMFKNPVTLEGFSFQNIDNLEDTMVVNTDYTVKNEVINVGDLNMIKPPFLDVVVTVDIFNNEPRKYPFEYNQYENVDNYDTEITIELPAGKSFDQVPGNVQSTFNDMKYNLSYEKVAPNRLVIKRTFLTNTRATISPEDHSKMRDFFNLIVKAEQKYISFK